MCGTMSVVVDETDDYGTTCREGTYIGHALAQGQVDVGKLRGLMVLELHMINVHREQLIGYRRYNHVSTRHRDFGLSR